MFKLFKKILPGTAFHLFIVGIDMIGCAKAPAGLMPPQFGGVEPAVSLRLSYQWVPTVNNLIV
jgi:hypothetical protein